MPIRPARPCPHCRALAFRWHPNRHGKCTACDHYQAGQSAATLAGAYQGEWPRIRRHVLDRDGRTCQLQLPGCTLVATTADHVVPLNRGGTDDLSNLRGACLRCNSKKQDRVTS